MRENNYQSHFIPKRLEINDRPELNHFPVNVLFTSLNEGQSGEQQISIDYRYSIYFPDFSTYTEGDKNYGMEYYNAIDRNWWL